MAMFQKILFINEVSEIMNFFIPLYNIKGK